MERMKFLMQENTISTLSSPSYFKAPSKRTATMFSGTLFIFLFSFGIFLNFNIQPSFDISSVACGRYNMDSKDISILFRTGRTLKTDDDTKDFSLFSYYFLSFFPNMLYEKEPEMIVEEDIVASHTIFQYELDSNSLDSTNSEVSPQIETVKISESDLNNEEFLAAMKE